MKKIQAYVTQDILKITALVAMSVDHIGKIGYQHIDLFTFIGRLAFPIFAYLIMFHLYQTNCFGKYLRRLLGFGLLTQVVFWPLGLGENNIFLSFFVAVFCLFLMQKIFDSHVKPFYQYILYGLAFVFCFVLSIPTDNSFLGFTYLLSLYGFFKYRNNFFIFASLIFGALLNPLNAGFAAVSCLTTLVLLLNIPHVPAKRLIKNKWFFYLYYPLHLIFLQSLKILNLLF